MKLLKTLLKIVLYGVIAISMSALVYYSYWSGVYVGQRDIVLEGLKAGVIGWDMSTGNYFWIVPKKNPNSRCLPGKGNP